MNKTARIPARDRTISLFLAFLKTIKKSPPDAAGIFQFLFFGRVDAHALAILADPLEPHHAVRQGEQGIVRADAHVVAGMDVGAALPHQDVAGQNKLPVRPLDAETLGLGIAAILVEPTPFL